MPGIAGCQAKTIRSDRPAAGGPGEALPARRQRRAGRTGGQSLVEFALVLGPLLLLLLAIIQFGFIFNAYVTLTNAVREGARAGTIYVYDRSKSKAQNDIARNEQVRTTILGSLNLLSRSAPQFSTGSTWSQSGLTFTNGDLTITYTIPSGVTDSDPRVGQQLTVRAVYHQDLVIPLIANLLPRDSGGRLALPAEVTMVIN
ncbi:MAG TPA: TadE family protein [Candidatus Binatia bacterium]|nr:TadE family protein [Candidatus Binatia bacterium]